LIAILTVTSLFLRVKGNKGVAKIVFDLIGVSPAKRPKRTLRIDMRIVSVDVLPKEKKRRY